MFRLLGLSREDISSRIPRAILVAVMILLALFAGFSVVQGKMKTLSFLAALPVLMFIWRLNERARFRLLLVASLLAPLHIPLLWIPPSQVILIALAVTQLAALRRSKEAAPERPTQLLQYVPYIIFAFAGLVAMARNGDLYQHWHTVCLLPLVWMFLATSMVRTPREALTIVRAVVTVVFAFLIIYLVAEQTGNVISFSRADWRLGGGHRIVVIGPIRFIEIWHLSLGTLVAVCFPAVIMLLIRERASVWSRCLYALLLVLSFTILLLTAARGATVAALAGALVVLIVSGRVLSPRLIATGVALILVALIWGKSLLNILPYQNLERLYTLESLRYGENSLGNLQTRLETLRFTIENVFQNPLGYGSGYLWNRYRIDETIVYSMLLNSAGLIGFVGFVLIVGQLLGHFVARMRSAFTGPQRVLVAIGLGTLISGLLAGIADHSIMFEPLQPFVFWAILATAYSGTLVPRRSTLNSRLEY